MRNIFFFLVGVLLSFLLIVPFASATEVGPFTGAPVSDRINYTSSPGTTYTKMVEQVSGPISSSGDSFKIPNRVFTTLPNGIQIEAELVTDLSKAAVSTGIWNAIKKGKANPYVTACMVLCPALIDQGWKWMNDAQQWVKTPSDVNGQPVTTPYESWGEYGKSGQYSSIEQACAAYEANYAAALVGFVYYTTITSGTSKYCRYYKASTGQYKSSPVYYYYPNTCKTGYVYLNGYCTLSGVSDVAVSDAEITQSVLDAMNQQAAADLIKLSELDVAHDLSHAPQSVTSLTPTAETAEKTISKTTTNNPDGTQTQKEVKQKEVVKTDTTTNNSTVNNTYIKYVTTTITNTYTNNNTIPDTTTEEPDSDGVIPPPDSEDLPDLPDPPRDITPLPSAVSGFINNIPWIPDSFSCSDPQFPYFSQQFSLPLCEWIEHFRGLFAWFWNVVTVIAIYLLVRNMDVQGGIERA